MTTSTDPQPATNGSPAKPDKVRMRGEALVARVKELIHEGNVRRIVVKDDDGRTVMEIPVSAGVIAAVAAPIVTAIGAIAALANEWTIEVHRRDGEDAATPKPEAEPAKPAGKAK